MRILQANPTGGVGLTFWALTPKTVCAFALPLVLRKVSQRPRCRPKPSLGTSCSCSPRGSVLPHSGFPCPLSGAEALWRATVGEMLVATQSCRDGSPSFGFSTPDSRPSLRDRKLSPKLQAFQPAVAPSCSDHKALLRVRVRMFLGTPLRVVNLLSWTEGLVSSCRRRCLRIAFGIAATV